MAGIVILFMNNYREYGKIIKVKCGKHKTLVRTLAEDYAPLWRLLAEMAMMKNKK